MRTFSVLRDLEFFFRNLPRTPFLIKLLPPPDQEEIFGNPPPTRTQLKIWADQNIYLITLISGNYFG